MEAPTSPHKFASLAIDLENWYWEHGCKRKGRFQLPSGGWARELRDLRVSVENILPSFEQKRPAAAVWGPSQTGKSTSVASYIDQNAVYTGDPAEDGTKSALHWPGGAPAYFIHPSLTKSAPGDLHRLVLNPYNSGLDASACLSRFVKGTLDPQDDTAFFIADPQYPIGVQLVKSFELWMSIARGYNSQCWGPKPTPEVDDQGRPAPRYQTVWTQDNFLSCFEKHANQVVDTEPGISRAAFERLHLLCRLVNDMIFAGLPRYRQLATGEFAWSKICEWILGQTQPDGEQANALVYSEEAANAFLAEVLWDGYQVVTDYALAMDKRLNSLNESFGEKPVLCSIEVAALFLDMETFKIYVSRPSAKPKPKETRYRQLLSELRWGDRGDCIVIGADSSLPNKLLSGPEDFGIVQGLVWELVIALNLDHISDNAFKSFVEVADILDFPGVERGGKESPADKIDLDILAEKKLRREYITEPHDTGHDPFQFFCKLLKRGKTSSIVCTYAQRMNIDIFNIFQDIDKDKPNGDELVTGINTWWQASAPDYFRNQTGRSPLPLNYVLLWWSEFFSARQDFTNISKKLEPVGQISNPEVSTAFAMNYYYIPKRGEMNEATRDSIPSQIEFLKAENAFARQFASNPISSASFESMLDDIATGGAEYFFHQLALQAKDVAENSESTPRLLTLNETLARYRKAVESLVNTTDLVPEVRESDDRRRVLLDVRDRIERNVEGASPSTIEAMEAALRFLLDVENKALRPIHNNGQIITFDTVIDQVQAWIRTQSSRPLSTFPEEAREGLKAVSLSQSDERNEFLQALVASIETELGELTSWMSDMVQHQQAGDTAVDLRRFLAVALSNLFTRIRSNDPFAEFDEEPETMDALLDEGRPSAVWNLKGRDIPRYHVFLKPFAGKGGVLEQLAMRDLIPITRPDQPGDSELLAILTPPLAAR
ncbi:hypothetical protein IEN85_09825 [Pelagicoccus sp. NFK12]|uniref:Uncharacterized protein n=1 Tax=Pelagicoccus enzymogenes TaxID=2773457 RepID=A0A927IHT3_9BACT|nr:hypothetical protein [Pelagicoccus enzymogenes]MBD5779790.1 hypothetical protein [Pelagicoccus enzymogenes]